MVFIILVGDMPTVTRGVKLLMYADETVQFYACKDSVAIQDALTNDADRVDKRE